MKFFYNTRKEMRNSNVLGEKVDCGASAPIGRRWAVDVSKRKARRSPK